MTDMFGMFGGGDPGTVGDDGNSPVPTSTGSRAGTVPISMSGSRAMLPSMDAFVQDPTAMAFYLQQQQRQIQGTLERIAVALGGQSTQAQMGTLTRAVREGFRQAMDDLGMNTPDIQPANVSPTQRTTMTYTTSNDSPPLQASVPQTQMAPPAPPTQEPQTDIREQFPQMASAPATQQIDTTTPPTPPTSVTEAMQRVLGPGDTAADPNAEHLPEGRPIGRTLRDLGLLGAAAEGAEHSLGPNIQGVRGSISEMQGYVAEHLSNIDTPYYVGDDGQVMKKAAPGDTGGDSVVRDATELSLATRTLSRVGRLKALGGVLQARGLTGILGGVTRAAGPVGIAIGVGAAGIEASERAFQSTLPYRQSQQEGVGGGLIDIGHEMWHGLTGIGTMGFGAAREQYQAAADLGLQGGSRTQAADFMRSAWMNWGMETRDSMAIIDLAVRNSSLNLTDLGTRITEVGKAAVAAGENASDAQRLFIQNLAQTQQQVTTTTAAPAWAQGATEVTTAVHGTPLQGLSTQGLLGTDTRLLMGAQAMGMGIQQYIQYINAPGAEGERNLAVVHNRQIEQFLRVGLGITTQGEARIQQALREQNPTGEGMPTDLDSGQAVRALQTALGGVPWLPEVVIQQAHRWGFGGAAGEQDPITEATAYIFVCFAVMGRLDQRVPERTQKVSAHDLLPREQRMTNDTFSGGGGMTRYNAQFPFLPFAGTANASPEAQRYLQQVQQSHRRNMVVEDLLMPQTLSQLQGAQIRLDGHNLPIERVLANPALARQLDRPDIRVEIPDPTTGKFREQTLSTFSDAFNANARPPARIPPLPGDTVQPRSTSQQDSTQHRVTVDITPTAARILRVLNIFDGPSEAQRRGVPDSGTPWPHEWSQNGTTFAGSPR